MRQPGTVPRTPEHCGDTSARWRGQLAPLDPELPSGVGAKARPQVWGLRGVPALPRGGHRRERAGRGPGTAVIPGSALLNRTARTWRAVPCHQHCPAMPTDTVPGQEQGSRGAGSPPGGTSPPSRQGAHTPLPPCHVLPRRAGSASPFSAERSHGEGAVARLRAAIRRHPPVPAGCGHPPWATSAGGSPAPGAGGWRSEGAGESWLEGLGLAPITQSLPRPVLQARGPKKHLKRVAAPKHWMLDKLTGVFVSAGLAWG